MWGISTQSSITGHKQLRVNVEHTRCVAQQQKYLASFHLNKAASCKITPRGAPPCGSTTSHLENLTFVWMQWKTVTKGVMLTTGNHKAFLTYWPLQVLCNRHEHAFFLCSILHMLRHLQRLVCPTNNDLVTRRMQAVASFPFSVAAN